MNRYIRASLFLALLSTRTLPNPEEKPAPKLNAAALRQLMSRLFDGDAQALRDTIDAMDAPDIIKQEMLAVSSLWISHDNHGTNGHNQ